MDELKAKYVGKFLGRKKISDIALAEFKTSSGSLVFSLAFEEGEPELISEKGLLFVKDEARDDIHVYSDKFDMIASECVKIVCDYDIPLYLFDRVAPKIKMELENHLQRALVIKMHGSPARYAPGFTVEDKTSLLEIDRINSQFPPDPAKENVAG